MAWIESHTSLEKHSKVIRLRVAMRWSKNETIGFLHRFWWTVLETSPSGDVSALSSPEVMSETLDLPVDVSARAFAAMLDVGWLERRGGRILVHDWLEYAGTYLGGSLFKRHPSKLEEIRKLHGLTLDRPGTVLGQAMDGPGLVPDTNQPTNQPTERDAGGRVEGFKPIPRSEEAAAHGAAVKAAQVGKVTQAVLDRALQVVNLYPATAKKDGRPIAKSLADQNTLAYRIASNPDYPWEEHAQLMEKNRTPPDLKKWVEVMPDPVALAALRTAAAPKQPERKYL